MPVKLERGSERMLSSESHYGVVRGILTRSRLAADGDYKLIDLLLPGDWVSIPDRSTHEPKMLLQAVTDCTLLPLRDIMQRVTVEPVRLANFAAPFARAMSEQQSRLLRHLVRLGSLSGVGRTIDFMMDVHDRLLGIGQVQDARFYCPLSQGVLGELLGVTGIHMNRIIGEIRRMGLFSKQTSVVHMPDPAACRKALLRLGSAF